MKFELDSLNRNVSDAELIDDVKRVAMKLNQDHLVIKQYEKHGLFSESTVRRRFGGWENALEKAGLKIVKKQRNTRIDLEDLFFNLEQVWVKLGRQPRISEMFEPLSNYSADVYKRRFGTWMTALEKFVTHINDESSNLTEQEIIDLTEIPGTRHKTKRDINWRLRFLVLKRDNFKCRICGRSPATDSEIILHVDHIKAWANGGETVIENLQSLCSKCNIGKSNLD